MVATPAAVSRLPDGGRFVALDSLRGICALGVAAFHVEGGGPLFESAVVRNAWLLVDFFFVLSGFVIAASYGDRLASGFPIRRYMLLRLGRIYPLHLAVLAAYVALELALWAFAPGGWSLREPFSPPRSWQQLLLALSLLQGFVPDASRIWNGQSWSIAIEVWLYLAMALAWAALGKGAWRAALAAAALAGLALVVEWDGVVPMTGYLLRGVLGFGVGVACWQIWRRREAWLGARVATAIEGAICLSCVAALAWLPPASWRVIAADVIFALAILIFAGERGRVSRWLCAGPWVLLGTLSYSIYMVHPLVLGRATDLLRFAGLGELVMADGIPLRRIAAPPLVADLIGLAMLAAAVAAAWLSWRWLEYPARQWSRRRAARFGAAREESAAPTI